MLLDSWAFCDWTLANLHLQAPPPKKNVKWLVLNIPNSNSLSLIFLTVFIDSFIYSLLCFQLLGLYDTIMGRCLYFKGFWCILPFYGSVTKCMNLLNLSVTGRMWRKANFQVEYSWFEFRVFLLLDWLLNENLGGKQTLALSEMQTASSRNWTLIGNSISYGDSYNVYIKICRQHDSF